MRAGRLLAMAAVLGALSAPASAEQRWLTCKVTDQRGQERNFFMVFDDRRNTAGVWDGVELIEGVDTAITFQAVRTRFPQFSATYNRNDGALSMTPIGSNYGGLLNGVCRRSAPPPNLPAPTR